MLTRGYLRRLLNPTTISLLCATALLATPALAQKAQPPYKRIISTAPSITEALYAMGLGDRIVAVDRFSRYPKEAQSKPSIGDYVAPNLEVIASYRPDVVMIPANPVHLQQQLEALQLNVLELNQDGLQRLYESYRTLGRVTGEPEAAQKLIESIQRPLADIKKRVDDLPRTRVMFVVGRTPQRLDGLIVVGKDSYLNEVIELAGGENIFRDASSAYPQISLEEVLARNPDVIVDMGDMADTVGVSEKQKQGVVDLWTRMSSLDAVRNHRVHAVAADIYVVPGPRVVDAVNSFFEMLHPEAAKKMQRAGGAR